MPNNFDFGSMVFNEAVMRERLAEDTYAALKDTIKRGAPLARHIATPVAAAMKEWAIEKGATHFTHWFQPLTGITAEKHEAFIAPGANGGAILLLANRMRQASPQAGSGQRSRHAATPHGTPRHTLL